MEYMEPQEIREYLWEEFKIMVTKDGTGPEEIFRMEYKDSQNFMTPETIGYGVISPGRNIVFELSRGTNLQDDIIFGITVTDGETRYYDDSQGGFRTLQEAMEHVQHLIERAGGH